MPTALSTAAVAAKLLGSYSTTVVDVGARWGAADAWWRIDPLAELVGFDPDAEECERLNQAAGDRQERYVPLALGRAAGTAPFYETADPACSSLYPQNVGLIKRFPALEVMRPVRSAPLELSTLDAWAAQTEAYPDISFIKLDTQGAELDILQGGARALSRCLGMEIEVQFTSMYHGVPYFAEVDAYMRSRGFVLWRLNDNCHYTWRSSPPASSQDTTHYGDVAVTAAVGSSRLAWGNAVYFRDFRDEWVSAGGPRRSLILASLLDALGDKDGACGCLALTLKCHGHALDESDRNLIEKRVRQLEAAGNSPAEQPLKKAS